MPLGPQPRWARGTVERPYSALRLRLALAIFGLVACVAGGAVLWAFDVKPIAWLLFAGAVIALIDVAVVVTRIRRGGIRVAEGPDQADRKGGDRGARSDGRSDGSGGGRSAGRGESGSRGG